MGKAMLAALALLAGAAHAQAVYRCGNEYRQSPCTGGKEVPVEDTRTAADTRKAEVQAQRNQKLADSMEKSRLAQESKAAGPSMIVTGLKRPQPVPAPKAADKPQDKKKAKKKQPEHFTAVAPAKP